MIPVATVVLEPFVGKVPAAKVMYFVVPPVTKLDVAVPVNVDVTLPDGVIEKLPEPAVPVNDGWKYLVAAEIEPPDTPFIYFSPPDAVVLKVNDGKEPAEVMLLTVAVPVPVK